MTRPLGLLALIVVLALDGFAQKRYLVSPLEEVVLLPDDESTRAALNRNNPVPNDPASMCNPFLPLYDGPPFSWVNGIWRAWHGDVMGQWYVVPATGTIDTIFFSIQDEGGGLDAHSHDSLVFIRVHRSRISPSYGPGIRPGPFAPPCQPWGYWISTNSLDGETAAFPDQATDTAWVSTIFTSATPSTPPIGEELWGMGGFSHYARRHSSNAVAMADLAPLEVEAGDVIFISIQLNSWEYHGPITEGERPMEFNLYGETVSASDEYYPSRNWKFYSHYRPSPSSDCPAPGDSIPSGWYARGLSGADSTTVALWDISYALTVTGNAPPRVEDQTQLRNTLETGAILFQATITDCYSAAPDLSEVASATVAYEVNGVAQPPLPMVEIGLDEWETSIPGLAPGSSVTGRVEAFDLEGGMATGPSFSYSVVAFGNEWYSVDTGYGCTPLDIRLTGTTLEPGSFFLPPTAPAGASVLDDGASGPHDLGDRFNLFNDEFRYAWIGVNGGLALSKTATETLDVNSNGVFLAPTELPWTFPGTQHDGRGDTTHLGSMPPMFIAPFWANYVLGDSSGSFGRIVIGDAGDTCLFVAEWDSIGVMQDGSASGTPTTFRVVLNRCTGAVEFQYDAIWTGWLESKSLTGMQGDTDPEPGYFFASQDGYPTELAPADGRCIRLHPTVGLYGSDGWSLVSLSAIPLDGDYSVSHLFPGYEGKFWTYGDPVGYSQPDSLRPGRGYWFKFGGNVAIGKIAGRHFHDVSIPVGDDWNLIGATSGFSNAGNVVPTGGTVASSWYGYGATGYLTAAFLGPGEGYWVKMNGAGTLEISDWEAIPGTRPSMLEEVPHGASTLVVRDATGRSQTLILTHEKDPGGDLVDPSRFEMPPPAPNGLFDARFASGGMLGIVGGDRALPIIVRDPVFPITAEWSLNPASSPVGRLTLSAPGSTAASVVIEGNGYATFDALPTGRLMITTEGPSSIPAEFALGPNYPNPFNPTTTFAVDLPVPADVRVEVVDLLGRSIADLLTGPQPAGSHRLTWNGLDRAGAGAPSGVYVVRLTSASFNATRKILLIR